MFSDLIYLTRTCRNKTGVPFTLMCVTLEGFCCINITNSCYFCFATRYRNSFSGGPELIMYHARNYQLKWSMMSSCFGRCSLKSLKLAHSLLLSMWKESFPMVFAALPSRWVQRVWTWNVVHVPLQVRELLSVQLGHLCAGRSVYSAGFIFLIYTYKFHRLPPVNHSVTSCYIYIYRVSQEERT